MNEELIGFETATLLAKLNFNWDSNFYYNSDNNLQEFLYYEVERNYETYDGFPDDVILFVPTQSLLQKWFREVHKIYVLVEYDGVLFDVRILNMNINESLNILSYLGSAPTFYTYEEALEEGLKCALNLIK